MIGLGWLAEKRRDAEQRHRKVAGRRRTPGNVHGWTVPDDRDRLGSLLRDRQPWLAEKRLNGAKSSMRGCRGASVMKLRHPTSLEKSIIFGQRGGVVGTR